MLAEKRIQIHDALLDILTSYPLFRNRDARDTILNELPSDLVFAISRSNSPVNDWLSIIQSLEAVGQLDSGEWPLVILMRTVKKFIPSNTNLGKRLESLILEYEISLNRQLIAPLPEIVIGADERLPITFLENALKAAKSVGRLLMPRLFNGQPNGSVAGTGWLISSNLLVTNYHVIAARSPSEASPSNEDLHAQVQGATAWFGYDTRDSIHIDYRFIELVQSNRTLDYAIIRIEEKSFNGDTPLSKWHHLNIVRTPQQLSKGARLNIIQHPQGGPKMLAIRSNFYVGQVSLADQPARIQYLTDTEPGASGSPVFDDNWFVVALHHAALEVPESQYKGEIIKYNNQGIDIHAILNDINQSIREEISASQGWN